MRRCSTRRCARATASAAAIRTGCSTRTSSWTTRSSTAIPGMTFGIHICRGNHKSMFYASGGYDRIAAHVFTRTRFDRYLLEYDDERSGHVRAARARARRPRGRARADQLEGAAARVGSAAAANGSRRRRRSCRSSGSRSARSAGSPRRTRATGCRRTINARSSSWWDGSRTTSGAEPDIMGWLASALDDSTDRSLERAHRSGPADQRPRGRADVAGTQPPLLYPAYQSTVLRAPSQPLIQLPRNFTDLAAPLFGYLAIGETDNDLTRQHSGEPLGERIVVAGRVLDEDGRPVPEHARRVVAVQRRGPLPARPRRSSGAARSELQRRRPDDDRRGRPLSVHDHQAGRVSVAQSSERLAPGAHPFLAVRHVVPVAAGHADVLSERPAVSARSDLQCRSPTNARGSG